MRTEQHFDIAIIGDGITGLSAAFHLQRLGASRICVISSKQPPPMSSHAAGLVSSGFVDNVTRFAHRHGVETASLLWDWSETAYDRLFGFVSDENIPVAQGERIRWLITDDEVHEAEQAVGLRAHMGLDAQLFSAQEALRLGYVSREAAYPVQHDGSRAAYVDPASLMTVIREKLRTQYIASEAFKLDVDSRGIHIETSSGNIRAEATILANHLGIETLVPSLADALVPFADQWHEWKVGGEEDLPLKPGSMFSWRHGHYWGGALPNRRIRLGGARFLRPLAGFEAKSAPLRDDITKHLKQAWEELFPKHPLTEITASAAGLDCWPCDELPVIGPMFGEPRILMATGYMGQGLALGFYAGCCVAELVQGLRPPLPRLLWPERLRSLAQETTL